MRTGIILDGNFLTDQRVINEVKILEDNGYEIFILNHPAHNSSSITNYSQKVTLIKASFSKKTDNYLFALANLFPFYDLLWYHDIKNLVKKYEIKLLHAHDLYLARAAGMAAKKYNIPLILDLHENYPAAINEYRWANRFPSKLFVRPQIWHKKEKKFLSYANRIIVLSSNYRENLLSKYPQLNAENIRIYPNVPDIQKLLSYEIRIDPEVPDDKTILFYFGLISKRRGIYIAIRAVEKLLPRWPELHLLLIGPIDKAEEGDFVRLFRSDSLKDHLTHISWKDIREFPSLVISSKICISPLLKNAQHESGVANKIFQYMLFGKPLIASDCTPQLEIINKAGCGLTFKSGDSSDMADKISQLLSDPQLCRKMGEKGRNAVLDEYNTEIKGAEILKAYSVQ